MFIWVKLLDPLFHRDATRSHFLLRDPFVLRYATRPIVIRGILWPFLSCHAFSLTLELLAFVGATLDG